MRWKFPCIEARLSLGDCDGGARPPNEWVCWFGMLRGLTETGGGDVPAWVGVVTNASQPVREEGIG